jgi:hypothetical protein
MLPAALSALRRVHNYGAPVAQYSRAMSSSIASKQVEPIEMRISDELLQRVQDKELLHTCGFIGGKWLQASDRSTFQVRAESPRRALHGRTSPRAPAPHRCAPPAPAGAEPRHRQAHSHPAQNEGR